MNADLRERVAKAMWESRKYRGTWEAGTTETERADYLHMAAAALSVAQGQGFVMVPRESTSAMDWAGVDAAEREHYIIPSEVAERIWAAMLAAAPAQPDGVGK